MTYSTSSLFFFLYFGAIGIIVPYWTLYLRHLQFTSLQIATLVAIPPMARIGIPLFTGYMADRFSRRRAILIAATAGQIVPLALIIWLHSYAWLLILISAFAILNSIILPLGEATVQEEQEKGNLDYGRTRLWGTVSFILIAIGYGKLLDSMSDEWILNGIVILFGLLFAAAFLMPEGRIAFKLQPHPLRQALTSSSTWVFFLCVMFMSASHGTFYGFYSIYLADLGFYESGIGIHWGVAAGSELIIFVFSSQILNRFRLESLISFCCFAAALRWFMTASTTSFVWLTIFQCLHAFSFGLFHATCIKLIHHLFPVGSRAIGQSLYYSFGGGIGSMAGILCSGALWDLYGGKVFYGSGVIMLLGLFLTKFLRIKQSGFTYKVDSSQG